MLDAFLTNCRLADGRVVDIGIADGKIAIVGEGAAPTSSNSAPALDIGGDLVLPGLVDGHMHLDKTLTAHGQHCLSKQTLCRRDCRPLACQDPTFTTPSPNRRNRP